MARIIPEGAWHALSGELATLKKAFKVTGEIKWKFFGTGNADSRNSLAHLSRADKDSLREHIFAILTARKAVRIIACVTSVEAAYGMSSIRSQDAVYHLTYKGVTERFQYFLQDASRVISQPQLGLVVADHRAGEDDARLRDRHNRLVDQPMQWESNYLNFVETVFFSPSHISVGLQFADMVAGAVHRSYQHGEHRFIEMLRPAFRASPRGEIYGYGLVRMPKGTFIVPPGGEAFASPTR